VSSPTKTGSGADQPDVRLPALRGLADLADCQPVIVIDSREPLQFENLPTTPGTLYAGGYSLSGLEASFAVERKSIDYLANCSLPGQLEPVRTRALPAPRLPSLNGS
jgi:hypothetical protein